MNREKSILKNGSTTYYWSSKYLPENTRKDVLKLYSFVGTADNFVNKRPQDTNSFKLLKNEWFKALKNQNKPASTKNKDVNLAVSNMLDVFEKYKFNKEWVTAFLDSTEKDIKPKKYKTLEQTLAYTYGSAEVVSLMMARIIGVKEEGLEYAKIQGRAMQYINFIRDINEDISMGRQYIPNEELIKYGLPELTEIAAIKHPAAYREFIEGQLSYYKQWQKEAGKGFRYVPKNQRIALRVAVDSYNFVAKAIAKNPYIVFDKKVKPSKSRVVVRALVRTINA